MSDTTTNTTTPAEVITVAYVIAKGPWPVYRGESSGTILQFPYVRHTEHRVRVLDSKGNPFNLTRETARHTVRFTLAEAIYAAAQAAATWRKQLDSAYHRDCERATEWAERVKDLAARADRGEWP